MSKEIIEILAEMYDIQVRYTKPLLKSNYTDKDYAIENYENIVFKMKNIITDLQNLLELRTDCLKMNQERIDKASDMLVCAYGGNDDYYMERIKKAQNILKGEDK